MPKNPSDAPISISWHSVLAHRLKSQIGPDTADNSLNIPSLMIVYVRPHFPDVLVIGVQMREHHCRNTLAAGWRPGESKAGIEKCA